MIFHDPLKDNLVCIGWSFKAKIACIAVEHISKFLILSSVIIETLTIRIR